MTRTQHVGSLQAADDPLWYKDAVIYELHVRAFCDSNGDGIGDFPGLVEKLDYLQDLGVTALWLLPFYPSPMRDDGYDISDYRDVNPAFGTLRDFKVFLREAHRRGLRVITELVINHTSDQHPWFQRARRAPKGSKLRDYYVWSDDPDRYSDTRIIFQDFESSNWTWDPIAEQYYWHRFYSHQPDLNFDNPVVQKEVIKTLDFWMEMGIDGMRLDAVPYLYEREGTNCENLPQTHQLLRKLRAHIDATFPNRMLLAEANQWPEDAAAYFGAGDECHMNFNFPLMPRMFMAVQLENSYPVTDILESTPRIPDSCQWAVFLRNHDELTLEMVTDEDRDYMYRVYAADPQARINLGIRRRLAPLMQTRQKVELMTGLLLSLPGTPVLYYGDEIGMGDNIYLGDRNGVRTPMQWSSDRNAGFSRANPQKLYLPPIIDPEYHYESVNVEAQQANPSSLLWWTKRMLTLRNQHKVFGRGTLQVLDPDNAKVLAFIRALGEQRILVVVNLSRFAQYVELDLREYAAMVPLELMGGTAFPPIGELPYLLTLAPHAFYWLELQPQVRDPDVVGPPTIEVRGRWEQVLGAKRRGALEKVLAGHLATRRWFRGKARRIKTTHITDSVPFETTAGRVFLLVVQVEYVSGPPETYVLPLGHAAGERARTMLAEPTPAVVAILSSRGTEAEPAVLYDPFGDQDFAGSLLGLFTRNRVLSGESGRVRSSATREARQVMRDRDVDLTPWPSTAEQSNSSVGYGHALILKVFRMLEDGENPDLELGDYLSRLARFAHVPAVAGSLTYEGPGMSRATLGVLQHFVPNQGNAWELTLHSLGQYFERSLGRAHAGDATDPPLAHVLDLARSSPPPEAADAIGPYLAMVRLLAERTAELHIALGSGQGPAFAPEPFTVLRQRSLYQSARTRLGQTFKLLRSRGVQERLSDDTRREARKVVDLQGDIDARLLRIVGERIEAVRVRCHGDFHLGQVLYTGKDFVFIDFEGEPARPLGERRFKRSALLDVAGMLRSFHYVTVAALRSGQVRAEDMPVLAPWVSLWHRWVCAAYLGAYLDATAGARFIPARESQLRELLDFHLLDKCVYELGYELNNRPDWLHIPLEGLLELLREEARA